MLRNPSLFGLIGLLAAVSGPGPALAEPLRVTVTREDCLALTKHVPDADVAYESGVDVYGRPVAPADLGGGVELDLPDVFVFDIEIQPFDYVDRRQLAEARADLDARLGINRAQARDLAEQGAVLAEREATFLRSYAEAAAAIIAQTGGPSETNAANLALRTQRLETLNTNRFGGADYLSLQGDLADLRRRESANQADAATLAQFALDLDARAARIDARGLGATTMSVGRVVVDARSGEASFNGRPLRPVHEAELIALCEEALKKPE